MNKNMLYRSIPKVDVLLEDPEIQGLIETYSRDTVVESIHLEMDALRKYIGTCEDEEKAKEQIGNLNMNILIWNTIWKPEDAERDIHILKNCSVRLQVQRLQWR